MLLPWDEIQEGWRRFPHLRGCLKDRDQKLLAALMGYREIKAPKKGPMNFGEIPKGASGDLSPLDLSCIRVAESKATIKETKPGTSERRSAEERRDRQRDGLRDELRSRPNRRARAIGYKAFVDDIGVVHCCPVVPKARTMAPFLCSAGGHDVET